MERLLSQGVHLTQEEKSFQLQFEQTMADLNYFNDELLAKKLSLEVDFYDHFVEVRRQIDIRREEVKARIDDLETNWKISTRNVMVKQIR